MRTFEETQAEFVENATPRDLAEIFSGFPAAIMGKNSREAMLSTRGSPREHIEMVALDQARLSLQNLMEEIIAKRS